VETRRLQESGDFDYQTPVRERGASPLFLTAILCVCGLIGVALWGAFWKSDIVATTPSVVAAAVQGSEDDAATLISTIAARAGGQSSIAVEDVAPMVIGTLATQYSVLKEQGRYTPETGEALAEKMAEVVRAPVQYKIYTTKDLKLSEDNSYDAMLAYRAELKEALVPLVAIEEPEIGFFAGYIETRDPRYLDKLRETAAGYTTAIEDSVQLTVPRDAAEEHVGILNAMGQFGAVLAALADNADDPITSTVLLQTFDEGEQNMVTSFNNLAMYYAHHPTP